VQDQPYVRSGYLRVCTKLKQPFKGLLIAVEGCPEQWCAPIRVFGLDVSLVGEKETNHSCSTMYGRLVQWGDVI